MNATAFGNQSQETVTTEKLLYDAAERVGRIREGRLALHVHMSRLLPQNRDEGKIRIAFRLMEGMTDAVRGQMFLLTNSDIVLICKDMRIADLDAMVYKLRALFSKDPITFADPAMEGDRFATYYDLETEYDAFLALCGELVVESKRRVARQRTAPVIRELDAKGLTDLVGRITTTDITSVVRRQACVRINDKRAAETVFQEFYMSIADLQKVLAPDVNLLSNRWLFQHLSQILDLQVLAKLQEADFRALPVGFSLNLNLATVDTPAFKRFLAAMRARTRIYVEVQLVDVFNNLDKFFQTRDILSKLGCVTILDGLNPITLQFLDAESYGTDYIKVTWSPEMATDIQTAEIVQALSPLGFDKVILSRCDSEDAIAWGLDLGIRLYQGRFLDAMVAAVTMAQCPQAAACTLQQCIQRHGVIGGRPRAECGDNAMLDAFPPLKALS